MTSSKKHFANYGSEKMIFDVRMGPQTLFHNDVIYIVYQANEHDKAAHPHIISYHCGNKTWSNPVQLGENPSRYDHHKGPILWMDDNLHLHVLYGCHITSGTHLISRKPENIAEWEVALPIAKTISYPTIFPIYDNKWVIFYRSLGHMGFWAYRISSDGGNSWTDAHRLIDFDQNPREGDDADSWAGSYHSVNIDADGRFLHMGFVYWDERRKVPHPVYNNIGRRSKKRYNLYYLRLDIQSGILYTIDGKKVPAPVNRALADETCKVWDTGHELSNMPSIAVGTENEPYFVLPVSEQSPWHCHFNFIARVNEKWKRTVITETNGNWAGCYLCQNDKKDFSVYVVTGDNGENLLYSGGNVEKWDSKDGGDTWKHEQALIPEPGLLYNNPKPVHLRRGGYLKDHLVIFGWEGPGSIQADPSPLRNRGRGYLWNSGKWL